MGGVFRVGGVAVSSVTVTSVGQETIAGGGHYGYKPPGWLATATVDVTTPQGRRSFSIGLGGTLTYGPRVYGAGADSSAK